MGDMLDETFANISSHIVIRDKNSGVVLLNVNPKRVVKHPIQSEDKDNQDE